MGNSNFSNRDSHLEDLKRWVTEEGIIAIREYMESGSMDPVGLANRLYEISPYFAQAVDEETKMFPVRLALTMVDQYVRIMQILN